MTTTEITLSQQREEQALVDNRQKYLPAKELSEIIVHFHHIFIY